MSQLSSAGEQPTAGEQPAHGTGPRDSTRQQLLEVLRAELDEAVVGSEVTDDDIWVRVDRRAWRRAGEVCRRRLNMDYFCFLSGIDWLPNPDLSGEKLWDPGGSTVIEGEGGGDGDGTAGEGGYQTGTAGGDTRFQVLARLYSTTRKVGVTLKADLDESDLRVPSWVDVYRGADWHERETWEMYGFVFDGHPALRHIYLPGEFEGHPLRKDFPLLAREVKPWPGLVDVEPIPGEEGDGNEALTSEGEANVEGTSE